MRLWEGTKKDADQDKDEEDLSKLEFAEVVSVQCNLFNSNYLQASKVLFTFVLNKQFGQLMLKTMLSTTNM